MEGKKVGDEFLVFFTYKWIKHQQALWYFIEHSRIKKILKIEYVNFTHL